MENLVCVQVYKNRIEAELAKSQLEGSGIESFISVDDCGGAHPFIALGTGGAELLVKKDDIQKARDILNI